MNFWAKPHPFIFNALSIIIPGIATAAIILIFTPFDFDKLPIQYLFGIAVGLGLIASACVWGTVKILQASFPKLMEEENWTLGKEFFLIFLVLMVISSVIFILLDWILIDEIQIATLFIMVLIRTLLIGIFPIIVMILAEQYNYQRKQLKAATKLNHSIEKRRANNEKENDLIIIQAENGKAILQLERKELLFLQSEGNYVDVYHLQTRHEIQKTLVRNRLKAIYEALPKNHFFACHKSYVVNLQHIQKITGNARNFELHLRHTSQVIPVSRAKSEELKSKLEQYSSTQ